MNNTFFPSNFIKPKPEPITPTNIMFTKDVTPDIVMTKTQCDWIIDYTKKNCYPHNGAVGTNSKQKVNKDIRSVELYMFPLNDKTKAVYEKIAYVADLANRQYGFDVYGIPHELQVLKYVPGGHYDWHVDISGEVNVGRKISLVCQLSNPKDYEGGELYLNPGGHVEAPKEQGSITTFPSYVLHKVCPINKGVRWALVSWVSGYHNFR